MEETGLATGSTSSGGMPRRHSTLDRTALGVALLHRPVYIISRQTFSVKASERQRRLCPLYPVRRYRPERQRQDSIQILTVWQPTSDRSTKRRVNGNSIVDGMIDTLDFDAVGGNSRPDLDAERGQCRRSAGARAGYDRGVIVAAGNCLCVAETDAPV